MKRLLKNDFQSLSDSIMIKEWCPLGFHMFSDCIIPISLLVDPRWPWVECPLLAYGFLQSVCSVGKFSIFELKQLTFPIIYSEAVSTNLFFSFLRHPSSTGGNISFGKKTGNSSIVCMLCVWLWPHNCSPPGLFIHGIFQARILEWVAITYSRQEYWSGLPLPIPGYLPTSWIKPACLACPALAALSGNNLTLRCSHLPSFVPLLFLNKHFESPYELPALVWHSKCFKDTSLPPVHNFT